MNILIAIVLAAAQQVDGHALAAGGIAGPAGPIGPIDPGGPLTPVDDEPVGPPPAVTNLSAEPSGSTVVLSWKTPMVNAGGFSAPPQEYDFRWSSTADITDLTWDDSSVVIPLEGEPAPKSGTVLGSDGTLQQKAATWTLPGYWKLNKTYRFAMKSRGGGGWSGLSNVAVLEGDTSSPAKVLGLSVVGVTESSLSVEWLPTGDNELEGLATLYRLSFSAGGAADVIVIAATAQAGEVESVTLTQLQEGTTYTLWVEAYDDVDNLGPASESVVVTTLANDDINHGGGDCAAASATGAAGGFAVFAAMALLAGYRWAFATPAA